jgi:flagellar motor switch protein FliG
METQSPESIRAHLDDIIQLFKNGENFSEGDIEHAYGEIERLPSEEREEYIEKVDAAFYKKDLQPI